MNNLINFVLGIQIGFVAGLLFCVILSSLSERDNWRKRNLDLLDAYFKGSKNAIETMKEEEKQQWKLKN